MSCNVIIKSIWFKVLTKTSQTYIFREWSFQKLTHLPWISSPHKGPVTRKVFPLQWRHNTLHVTDFCDENSPVTGEFPAQKPSTRKIFPFDDVIMPCDDIIILYVLGHHSLNGHYLRYLFCEVKGCHDVIVYLGQAGGIGSIVHCLGDILGQGGVIIDHSDICSFRGN